MLTIVCFEFDIKNLESAFGFTVTSTHPFLTPKYMTSRDITHSTN